MQSASVVAIDYFLNPKEVVSQWRGETLPPEFDVGFDRTGHLDREWVWIAKKGEEVVGVLLASPCHGVAVIWRIAVSQSASPACVLKLLRQFMRDGKKRFPVGYMTLIQPQHEKLRKLMEHYKARDFGQFSLVAGPIVEVKCRE